MTNVKTLQKKLPKVLIADWIRGENGLEYVEELRQPKSLIVDGRLLISDEDGELQIDYYGEYRGECGYINPVLDAWAKKMGGMWEWQHPGAIAFID